MWSGLLAFSAVSGTSWMPHELAIKTTFDGFVYAAEYDMERKFREVRLHQLAPGFTHMILSYFAQHALDLPRSF
jgi:acyl-CoA dehydrogenase